MKKFTYFLSIILLIATSYVKADDISATITNAVTGVDNGAIELTISGGTAPYSFSWTGPGGFISTEQNLSDLPPGEYCVTVSDHYCGIAQLCITVEEQPLGIDLINFTSVKIYPDPFKNFFRVQLNVTESGEYYFKIVDITGRIAYSEKRLLNSGDNEFIISQPELSAGLYQLLIENGTGELLNPLIKY